MQGDDYIMYCHPAEQKNPKARILREWYHALLDEAARRGIVTFRSTLYDTFFPGGRDHALAAPTVKNLPYFEGDFWPGEAETQLTELASGKATPSAAFSFFEVVDTFCGVGRAGMCCLLCQVVELVSSEAAPSAALFSFAVEFVCFQSSAQGVCLQRVEVYMLALAPHGTFVIARSVLAA